MNADYFSKAQFLTSAAKLSQTPIDIGREVAFSGRSNAGKSSALNCLTGRKGLAKTSKTPGRTRLLNFFILDESHRLVDLPGYGYAKVSQSTQSEWEKSLGLYLLKRESLQGIVVLMDIRHPLKPLDYVLLNWANYRERPVHILLTKADKLSYSQIKQAVTDVEKKCSELSPLISFQTFSSKTGLGLDELVEKLSGWLEVS